VAIFEFTKKTRKWKFLTPMSNLNWLQAAVRKFNSGANVDGISIGANYNSYRILSLLSKNYLHALIRLTVSELCNFEIDRTAGISV
jgi:hypothetical protein